MRDDFDRLAFRQEVMKIAFEIACERGRREILQKLISNHLVKRFGAFSAAIVQELQDLLIEEGEDLAKAIFDFETQDDLKNWFAKTKISRFNLTN